MGIQFRQDEEGITLLYNKQKTITEKLKITTFTDHRITMGMAIFGLKHKLYFDHPECVSKSFPNFWQEWSQWFNVEY
jgi:5-enolpyruvylshikimate-3-phosphate synthase